MGLISTFLGFSGFGIGVSAGHVIGCYLFIYFQPTDVKDLIIRPLVERDFETLQSLLPEIPMWLKNPDFDRAICKTAKDIAKPIIAEQIQSIKLIRSSLRLLHSGLCLLHFKVPLSSACSSIGKGVERLC
ncbi:hypothetical protein L6452_02463 [Arctium lappa]|uniref:Uncharacterized protein n=1 Tax=Arctium lappa TaxID=4217 RepID=A0ACB9FKD8_ARCLA|nr:hypothetical protein L6452_02463 [Arctium lappa]